MSILDHIIARPWAITADGLETILAVAQRANEAPEHVSARLGRPLQNTRGVTHKDGVAIVPIVGPIFRHANLFTEVSGATSTERLADDLAAALDDPQVRAIALSVDSPGGEANGIADLADAIRAGSQEKPIVAHVGGSGCSGAYWLAAAADRIVASPTSFLGSIGVVLAVRPDRSSKIEIVSSGAPNKRQDLLSVAGLQSLQERADALEAEFVGDVARFRGVSPEAVLKDFGKGGVLPGRKAVAAKMADRLGTLDSVISDLSSARRESVRVGLDPPRRPAGIPERGPSMSFRETVGRWFALGQPDDFDPRVSDDPTPPVPAPKPTTPAPPTNPPPAPPPPPTPQSAAEVESLRAEVARLTARDAERESARIDTEAAVFAREMVHAGKILPAESANVRALYAQAARDDAASPARVGFLVGPEARAGSRVEALAASLHARPGHRLFSEQVVSDQHGLPPGLKILDPGAAADPLDKLDAEVRAAEAKRQKKASG